jgi:hypothetical protein
MRKSAINFVLLWLICATGAGWAQVDTGTLTGSIKDSSGALLPDAAVTATNLENGAATSAKADASGNYVLTPLRIGTYSLTAKAAGFGAEVRTNIVLNVQQSIRLDFIPFPAVEPLKTSATIDW